ncbi:MAG: acyl-CoA dehydrogenase family protein [Candidatus Velthaea sp.]
MAIDAAVGGEPHNQSPPLADYDVYATDAALREGVTRYDGAWAAPQLHAIGTLAGAAETIALGFDANRFAPQLRTHDPRGERIDEVEFHPAWHHLLTTAIGYGLHAAPWREPHSGAHLARAAGFYVWTQVEAGHGCPISMTYAAMPALRQQPELAARWTAAITSSSYDFGLRPLAEKAGVLCGMGMTERQGGSDVRTNTTRALPLGDGRPGGDYRLDGAKWFCSAPMCDAFFILAQAPDGLSCFFLPRVRDDGTRNGLRIARLKDKLGNRSNASAEVEFEAAVATLIGEPGRGIATIIEMVNFTRLDCVIGSAAGMRQAFVQAVHHATYRRAFGKALIDQPLMQSVLADLALESEAATQLALRLAHAADTGEPLRRIATAIAKFYVCKRAAGFTAEALECLGGNGYVEESIAPRLYREAPLNSLWEGAGNVNALDVLRAAARSPETLEAYFREVELARGSDRRLDRAIGELRAALREGGALESRARYVVERLALVLQASLLVRHAPAAAGAGWGGARGGGAGGWREGGGGAGGRGGGFSAAPRPG